MSIERIALVSYHTCPNALLGEGKAGGMNVYIKALGQQFGNMGIKVDIFTRCHAGQESPVVSLSDNVRVVHLSGGPLDAVIDSFASHVPDFIEAMLHFQQEQNVDYQVVHSHYWLSGWVGHAVARRWKLPHVVAFHTLAETKRQARSGEREHDLRSTMEASIMTSAQAITCSSIQEKEAMIRLYGAPPGRIHVIPCGVDLSLFQPMDGRAARNRLGLNGEKLILSVGRIEPIKGFDILCHASALMEMDEPFKVLIVGGDQESDVEVGRLKLLGQEMGVAQKLEFVGRLDQSQLPFYYSAADVCAVPSYYESFSLVALEAMACGTPVVGFRVGGLPAVVDHGKTGYLHWRRCPEPFADSLQVLLTSIDLNRSMGLAARKRAETMGWQKVADEMVALYETASASASV